MTDNLVIGSNGMVGHALMAHLSDAVGTFRNHRDNSVPNRKYEYLDITQSGAVYYVLDQHKPKKIFIAAANPYVDGCENTDTDKVNIDGIERILNNAYLYGSQVIFFSSSYVFNGKSDTPYKPTDPTDPINRYGRQKEKIEKTIQEFVNLKWLIIRTVGVFGEEQDAKNFVAQVVRAVQSGKKIRVPADQTMNPIWAMDLARVTVHLSNRYTNEIFHVSGDKCMTKYDFAIKVAYMVGCTKPHELIVGMKSEDMEQIAPRPANGCLDCNTLTSRAMVVPNFEKGLKRYLG